jgi:hypothetical protein
MFGLVLLVGGTELVGVVVDGVLDEVGKPNDVDSVGAPVVQYEGMPCTGVDDQIDDWAAFGDTL